MCENDSEGRRSGQDESDIPITGLGSPHVILNNVKGPIISSHLFTNPPPPSPLPDCWNSSFCTIANALKLFSDANEHNRPFSIKKNYSEAKRDEPGGLYTRFFVLLSHICLNYEMEK